jgi:arsenate reductase
MEITMKKFSSECCSKSGKESKKTILFLCTHNSARSQLAEALTNHYFGDKWQAFSAGTAKTIVKPEVKLVLEEEEIDTTALFSKTLAHFQGNIFDLVVTLCDSARDTCPYFPGKKNLHHSFSDPSDETNHEKRVIAFRRTKEEIKKWLEKLCDESEINHS